MYLINSATKFIAYGHQYGPPVTFDDEGFLKDLIAFTQAASVTNKIALVPGGVIDECLLSYERPIVKTATATVTLYPDGFTMDPLQQAGNSRRLPKTLVRFLDSKEESPRRCFKRDPIVFGFVARS
jgi:hypothetical protein